MAWFSPLDSPSRGWAAPRWHGPYGSFTWTGGDGQPVLLVGAGSGLMQLMPMICYAVAAERGIPTCLVWSVITYDHALYRRELGCLSDGHPQLRVVHSVTLDPGETRTTYHQRIDRELLAEVLGGEVLAHAYFWMPPSHGRSGRRRAGRTRYQS